MDPQHWNRTIRDYPIANGLDRFRSEARRSGVCDSADVDQLIEIDAKLLAIELLFGLRSHPAAGILQGTRGSVLENVDTVSRAVITGSIEMDCVRRLLKAAITNADDKTLWSEVLALTATLTTTDTATNTILPPPRLTERRHTPIPTPATETSNPIINVSQNDGLPAATTLPGPTAPASPIVHTTAGISNSAEFQKHFRKLMKQELEDKLHLATPGFLEEFFPSSRYQPVAERFYEQCMTGEEPAFNVETHRWEDWPDPAVEKRAVSWLKIFITKLEEFSRPDFPSDVSNQRAVLGLPHTYIKGQVAKRKMDACFVSTADQESAMETLTYFWSQVLGATELKAKIPDEKKAELALGQYVRLSMTTQYTRRYVLGFTLCGPLMRVWLFDRQGGIGSERININENPLQFIKVILGFLWMSKEDLGFDPTIKEPEFTLNGPHNSDERKRYIVIEKQGQNGEKQVEHVILDEQMSKMSCVVGRGTTCWKAHVKGRPEEILVVKDSWENTTRPPEGDMLVLAESRGVVNVARHYHHETVQIRGMDDDILTCVRRGLPPAVTAWDYKYAQHDSRRCSRTVLRDLRNRETMSTNGTASDLHPQKRICYSSPADNAIEPPTGLPNRVHRRVIVRDCGKSIYKASSRVALLACLEDCIKGHQSLYKAGILHRDISINNLLIKEETATDRTEKGFLIDLDLAIQTNRPDTDATERSQRTRTATRAFMAIGVIRGEEHTFLHDLESFFWVLLWICIHYGKSGNDPQILPNYDRWNYLDDSDLRRIKKDILTTHQDFETVAKDFMPYYQPLKRWINQLRELLPIVVQLPGMILEGGEVPKIPDEGLYERMIQVLQNAQKDPLVLADG